jgi:hypothetical protein
MDPDTTTISSYRIGMNLFIEEEQSKEIRGCHDEVVGRLRENTLNLPALRSRGAKALPTKVRIVLQNVNNNLPFETSSLHSDSP